MKVTRKIKAGLGKAALVLFVGILASLALLTGCQSNTQSSATSNTATNDGKNFTVAKPNKPLRNVDPDNLTDRAQTKRAVVLAVVLLVAFWLLKAVNYLPTFW